MSVKAIMRTPLSAAMSDNKSRWTFKRSTLVVLIMLLGLGLFSPTLVAFGWRVWHGGSVVHEGKRISLPLGWMQTPRSWSGHSDVTLMSVPPTLLSRSSSSVMTFERISGLAVPTYDGWRKSIELVHKPQGDSIVGPEMVRRAGEESFCMTVYPTHSKGVFVSCLLFNRTWRADYIGSKETVKAFFDVIREIS